MRGRAASSGLNSNRHYPTGSLWPIELRADMVAALLDFRTTHELCKALAAGEAPRPTATRIASSHAEPTWFRESVLAFVSRRHAPGQLALCFSTTASKVSSSLFARNLMFAPDIQTSLQSSDLLLEFDIQSFLFSIFQIPNHFRPISSLSSAPSGRRYIDQWEALVMSLPTIRARISFSLSNRKFSCADAADPQTNAGKTMASVRTPNIQRIMTGPRHICVVPQAN